MGFRFDGASSEGLRYTTGPVPVSYPATLGIWFKIDSAGTTNSMLALGEDSAVLDHVHITAHSSNILRSAHVHYSGSAAIIADTTNSWSPGVWQHGITTFSKSGSNYTIENWLAGEDGNKGSTTDTTVTDMSTNDEIWVGGLFDATPGNYTTGVLAHAVVWQGDLAVYERIAMGMGVPPWKIRPEAQVFYAPLIDSDIDILNPLRSITYQGSPVLDASDNPPLMTDPDEIDYWLMAVAAAAGVQPSPYYYQYLQGAA